MWLKTKGQSPYATRKTSSPPPKQAAHILICRRPFETSAQVFLLRFLSSKATRGTTQIAPLASLAAWPELDTMKSIVEKQTLEKCPSSSSGEYPDGPYAKSSPPQAGASGEDTNTNFNGGDKSDEKHEAPSQQLGSTADTKSPSKGSSRLESRSRPPRPMVIDPCPRCFSKDTKFCYYNNYNVGARGCMPSWPCFSTSPVTLLDDPPQVSQPRFLCKVSHIHYFISHGHEEFRYR